MALVEFVEAVWFHSILGLIWGPPRLIQHSTLDQYFMFYITCHWYIMQAASFDSCQRRFPCFFLVLTGFRGSLHSNIHRFCWDAKMPVGMVPVQPKLLEQATLERRADRDYVLKVPREAFQMGKHTYVKYGKTYQTTDPTKLQRKEILNRLKHLINTIKPTRYTEQNNHLFHCQSLWLDF